MVEQTTSYGFGATVDLPYAEAVRRAQGAGGVLTEMDGTATLEAKLGVDFPPYVILGACTPPRAGEGRSVISAVDLEAALSLTGNAVVGEVAPEVRVWLERALSAVAPGADAGADVG